MVLTILYLYMYIYTNIIVILFSSVNRSDFLIKVVNLDNEGLVFTLEGHEAPVLCIKFNDSLLVREPVYIYIYMYNAHCLDTYTVEPP